MKVSTMSNTLVEVIPPSALTHPGTSHRGDQGSVHGDNHHSHQHNQHLSGPRRWLSALPPETPSDNYMANDSSHVEPPPRASTLENPQSANSNKRDLIGDLANCVTVKQRCLLRVRHRFHSSGSKCTGRWKLPYPICLLIISFRSPILIRLPTSTL